MLQRCSLFTLSQYSYLARSPRRIQCPTAALRGNVALRRQSLRPEPRLVERDWARLLGALHVSAAVRECRPPGHDLRAERRLFVDFNRGVSNAFPPRPRATIQRRQMLVLVLSHPRFVYTFL